MRGLILDWDVDSKTGLIRGSDDKKYKFSLEDWKTKDVSPKAGHEVDFDVAGDLAENVYQVKTPPSDIKDTAKVVVETSKKAGSVFAKLVFAAIVFGALIGLGNYAYLWNEGTKKTDDIIADFENTKRQAEMYEKSGKLDEALKLYLEIHSSLGFEDYGKTYHKYPNITMYYRKRTIDHPSGYDASRIQYIQDYFYSYEHDFKILTLLKKSGSLLYKGEIYDCKKYLNAIDDNRLLRYPEMAEKIKKACD